MPDELHSFRCDEENSEGRLDKFLSSRMEASRSQIQKWIKDGLVRVNGLETRKNASLQIGDTVDVSEPPKITTIGVEPENIPLDIVYEDSRLVVVDKPKGMVTHPGNGVRSGTLANALAHHFKTLSDAGGADRPGIVHRLDRDTSGLLVVARDNHTHAALARQLAERHIHRTYETLCWREPSPEGTFDWPLGRHPKDPLRRAIVTDGKPAVTHYHVLAWYQFCAHLEVRLETGRTHQIRVHLQHLDHPILGDETYGGAMPRTLPFSKSEQFTKNLLELMPRQALHAETLRFRQPTTGEHLAFSAPLPPDMQAVLEKIRSVVTPDVER